MTHERGFTLVELMVVVAIAAVILGMASWQAQRTLLGWRAAGVAQELASDVRGAAALAARLNRTVQLVVQTEGAADCLPQYRIQDVPLNVADQPVVFKRVCIAEDYPGIVLGNGGVGADVSCAADADVGAPALANCSLCAGTNAISFFPSGQVNTPAAVPNGASIVFSPRDEPLPSQVAAVGVRAFSGRARVYRATAGGGWTCP